MVMRKTAIFAGLAAACALSALPATAESLKPEEARRLVVGKLFSFTCFEGTTGAGRIYGDGSVSGVIRFQGSGAARYVALPPGTLRVKGEAVCAAVRGAYVQPCFDLVRLDERTFRGAVSGLGFASCTFTRRSGRTEIARSLSAPRPIQSSVAGTPDE